MLCARRAAPLAVLPAVAVIFALAPVLGFDVAESAAWILLLAFACLSTGLLAPRSLRSAGLACVLGALAVTAAGLAWFTDLDPNLLFGSIFSLGPWALGVALQQALDRNRRLGAEAEHARIERALAAERNRISAELHDALAHTLGAMVEQASVGSDLLRRDPGAAAAALRDVAQAGRDALGEAGRLLRLIRDDRDELGLHVATRSAEPGAPATPAHAVATASGVGRADLLLPALFGVVGTLEIAWEGYEPVWASVGAYWLALGALCARRALPLLMPVAVSGILLGGGLLGVPTGEPASWVLVAALACFAAGLHVHRSRAGWRASSWPTIRSWCEAVFVRCSRHGASRFSPRPSTGGPPSKRPVCAGLVVDIRMPVMDGIAATREVVAAGFATRVQILTTYDLDEYVYEALRAGAAGFMLKATPADRLVDAIEVVAAGEALLAPSLTQRLIAEHVRRPPPSTGVPEELRGAGGGYPRASLPDCRATSRFDVRGGADDSPDRRRGTRFRGRDDGRPYPLPTTGSATRGLCCSRTPRTSPRSARPSSAPWPS